MSMWEENPGNGRMSPQQYDFLDQQIIELAPTHTAEQIARKIGMGIDWVRRRCRMIGHPCRRYCSACNQNRSADDFKSSHHRWCLRHEGEARRDSQSEIEAAINELAAWAREAGKRFTATGDSFRPVLAERSVDI